MGGLHDEDDEDGQEDVDDDQEGDQDVDDDQEGDQENVEDDQKDVDDDQDDVDDDQDDVDDDQEDVDDDQEDVDDDQEDVDDDQEDVDDDQENYRGKQLAKRTTKRRTVKSVCGKCGTEIMHWVHYAAAGDIPSLSPGDENIQPDFEVNKRIFIHDGSISEVESDVVVLSCTKSIAPRGMKAIYDMAGPELSRTARKLGPKQVTELVETEGFLLPSRRVFHVVVPQSCFLTTELEELEQCTLNVLNELVSRGYKSLAMPCLGSGATTITLKESCVDIQLRTMRTWMDTVVDGIPNAKRVVTIILCRWFENDIIAYDKLLHKWFPTEVTSVTEPVGSDKKFTDVLEYWKSKESKE